MTFLSPLLLSGLALASVPVIIHLLNRRRFIRIDWAPMAYLKLTIRKNRKRIQLEQWLLLAVRVLAVAALFFAVSRPTISNNALAQLLAAHGRAARFIVIDDSLSMAALSSGKSALARAKEAAVELLKHAEPQDTITVMTSLEAETPLIRDAHRDQADAITAVVKSVEPTQAFGQWGGTFEKIDAHVQRSSQPVREVVLITDLRAAGWDAGVSDVVDRWAAGNVSLRIIDVGGNVTGNVVLKSLEQTAPIALVQTPVSFLARIHNDGSDRIPGQEGTLTVDGKPQSIQLPDLPAKSDVDVPVTVTFDSPGMHALELALPRDSLPDDNVRSLSVDVHNSLGIEVVDGEPDPRPFESETDFLELAYSVGRAPWQITRMTDSQWASNPLLAPDVLVLANVGSISEQRAAELSAQVEAGLGLMIFLGEQVDPTAYNRILYHEGRGLLPAEIVRYREEEASRPRDRKFQRFAAGAAHETQERGPCPRSGPSGLPRSRSRRRPATRSACWPAGTIRGSRPPSSKSASAKGACCSGRSRPTRNGAIGRPTVRTCWPCGKPRWRSPPTRWTATTSRPASRCGIVSTRRGSRSRPA